MMCNSNSECRAMRSAMAYMPLKEHEEQLMRCHNCVQNENPKVSERVQYKTDFQVRISYVKKYNASIQEMRAEG